MVGLLLFSSLCTEGNASLSHQQFELVAAAEVLLAFSTQSVAGEDLDDADFESHFLEVGDELVAIVEVFLFSPFCTKDNASLSHQRFETVVAGAFMLLYSMRAVAGKEFDDMDCKSTFLVAGDGVEATVELSLCTVAAGAVLCIFSTRTVAGKELEDRDCKSDLLGDELEALVEVFLLASSSVSINLTASLSALTCSDNLAQLEQSRK